MGKSGIMKDFFRGLDVIEKEMCGLCGCLRKPPKPPSCAPGRRPEKPDCRPQKPAEGSCCQFEKPDCQRPDCKHPPCGRERFCCEIFRERMEWK